MLEFVTVKDQLLAFLKAHQNDVIDSDNINNDLMFNSQPNGVVQACIDEMAIDKAIILYKKETNFILILTHHGERILSEGGYVRELINKKKFREKTDTKAEPLYLPNTLYKRNRQIAVISNTVNALSIVSALLFKRI